MNTQQWLHVSQEAGEASWCHVNGRSLRKSKPCRLAWGDQHHRRVPQVPSIFPPCSCFTLVQLHPFEPHRSRPPDTPTPPHFIKSSLSSFICSGPTQPLCSFSSEKDAEVDFVGAFDCSAGFVSQCFFSSCDCGCCFGVTGLRLERLKSVSWQLQLNARRGDICKLTHTFLLFPRQRPLVAGRHKVMNKNSLFSVSL